MVGGPRFECWFGCPEFAVTLFPIFAFDARRGVDRLELADRRISAIFRGRYSIKRTKTNNMIT